MPGSRKTLIVENRKAKIIEQFSRLKLSCFACWLSICIIVKKLKRSTVFFILALGWFIITTWLLVLPGDDLPGPGFFNIDIPWMDKWVHIGLFSIMAFLTCLWIYKKQVQVSNWKKYFIICGLVCLGYGIAMEFVQKYYVPGRSFDPGDIVADGVGSLLGVLYILKKFKFKSL